MIPFSDVRTIRIGPGKKKLFWGYGTAYLLVDTAGGTLTFPMFGDHDWALKTATAAQSAHQTYRLSTS